MLILKFNFIQFNYLQANRLLSIKAEYYKFCIFIQIIHLTGAAFAYMMEGAGPSIFKIMKRIDASHHVVKDESVVNILHLF